MSDFGTTPLGFQDSGLGSYLRHERETQGMTLEQLAASTKITLRVLQALEADHYEDLPAKPFVRGFVTSYCRALKLNGKEVLARYESFLDEKIRSNGGEASGVVGYAFEKKDGERSRTFLWVAMGVFVVFGGVGLLVLKPALKRRQVSHLEQMLATPATPAPPTTPSTALPVPQGAVALPTENAEPLGLKPSEALVLTPPPPPMPPPAPAAVPVARVEPKVFQKTPMVLAPVPEKAAPEKVAAEKIAPEKAVAEKVVTETPPEKLPTEKVMESSVDSMEPGRKPAPDDTMNKGDTLAGPEIRHKVVLKSLADVWVRYQVDDHPSMRFVLPGGKMLVLRAKKAVHVQVSNPKAVQVRFNKSMEFVGIEKAKSFDSRKGNAFAALSEDGGKQASEIFSDLDMLPTTPDPVPGVENSEPGSP